MELAQAEALRVLNDHERGVGHVHPHLDDGGGHQHIQLPPVEGAHHVLLLPGLHPAVDKAHPQLGEHPLPQLPGVGGHRLQIHAGAVLPTAAVFLHRRAHDIHLPPLAYLLADKAVHPRPLVLPHQEGVHRGAARRQLVHDGHIQIAIDDQGQGPGDGSGGHNQDMGRNRSPFFRQRPPLGHAEAVLLVGDDQPQRMVLHPLGEQGVGSHNKVGLPRRQGGQQRLFLPPLHRAGEQGHPHPGGGQQGFHGPGVLLRQQLGGRHKGALRPVFHRRPGPEGGHRRLSRAHVPLHQPVHGPARAQVGGDVLHGPALRPGGREGEQRRELLHVPLHHPARPRRAPVLELGQAAGEDEQLLEHQPPPGDGQRLIIVGVVDVFPGKLGLT